MSQMVTVGVGYMNIRTKLRHWDRLTARLNCVPNKDDCVTFGYENINKCVPEPPTTYSSWLKEEHWWGNLKKKNKNKDNQP